MKNACILLKKELLTGDSGEGTLFATLSSRGYFLEEIRILSLSNAAILREGVKTLFEKYDNLFLLTERGALSTVRGALTDILATANEKTEYRGACLYAFQNKTLVALSIDGKETGEDFFVNACIPYFQEKRGVFYGETVVRAVGVNQGRVDSLLSEINRLGEGKIRAWHCRNFDDERITVAYDTNLSKIKIDAAIRLLIDGLGDTTYAMNDVSLEEQLVTLLSVRGKKLSVAESFTGGGIAKRITSVAGASKVYFEGVNTYAEEAKICRLGVSEYTLRTLGAVSDETAYQMANGLLQSGNCDIAIATTGLAGPTSTRSTLPVGLAYIAVGTKERIFVYRYQFDGNRKEITEKAINYALFLAYKQLKTI